MNRVYDHDNGKAFEILDKKICKYESFLKNWYSSIIFLQQMCFDNLIHKRDQMTNRIVVYEYFLRPHTRNNVFSTKKISGWVTFTCKNVYDRFWKLNLSRLLREKEKNVNDG